MVLEELNRSHIWWFWQIPRRLRISRLRVRASPGAHIYRLSHEYSYFPLPYMGLSKKSTLLIGCNGVQLAHVHSNWSDNLIHYARRFALHIQCGMSIDFE